MASFTMDGTTIFSKSGSNITYANGTLGSGTTFPSGHVIKYYSQTRSSGLASINHDITTSWTKISFGGNFEKVFITSNKLASSNA